MPDELWFVVFNTTGQIVAMSRTQTMGTPRFWKTLQVVAGSREAARAIAREQYDALKA